MPRPHKMFQYVQTTRRQIADELFECLTILWSWHLKCLVNVPLCFNLFQYLEAYFEPSWTSTMELFLELLTIFANKLHRRCLTGF